MRDGDSRAALPTNAAPPFPPPAAPPLAVSQRSDPGEAASDPADARAGDPAARAPATGSAAVEEMLRPGAGRPSVAVAPEAHPELAIRMPGDTGTATCALCGAELLLAGPTGFRGVLAVCDGCLLRSEPELGMLLALAAVMRSYGGAVPEGALHEAALRTELLAFARVFEKWARKRGPSRPMVDPPNPSRGAGEG